MTDKLAALQAIVDQQMRLCEQAQAIINDAMDIVPPIGDDDNYWEQRKDAAALKLEELSYTEWTKCNLQWNGTWSWKQIALLYERAIKDIEAERGR